VHRSLQLCRYRRVAGQTARRAQILENRAEVRRADVDAKTFHVKRLKGCDSGPHEFYNGESQAVRAWLVERAKMNPSADVDTLFISERRKPLSRITVWLMIRQTAESAGLEHLKIHPHMLRHSCGYALVNKGTDIRIIQGYLGHRSISSTVRYTQLDSKRFAKLF